MARRANPWLGRRPFHWAHQGGAKEAPSNTLRAMGEAMRHGAHGLELDVHRSLDGKAVVIHDDTLQRTTDRSGWVARLSAADLARVDAAYWWARGFVDNHDPGTPEAAYELRGEADKVSDLGVPTVDDILREHPGVPMTIEVKTPDAIGPLLEALAVHDVAPDDLILTSFDDEIVAALHHQAPHLALAPARRWSLGFTARARLHWRLPDRGPYVVLQVPHRLAWSKIVPGRLGALLPRGWELTVATARLVEAAHRAGLAVHVWTVDDETEMRHLLDRGVDGIMTDAPTVLSRVLAERTG